MLAAMLPFMRCPRCGGSSLKEDGSRMRCTLCDAAYAIRDGVVDTLGEDTREVITPFQRIMQTNGSICGQSTSIPTPLRKMLRTSTRK